MLNRLGLNEERLRHSASYRVHRHHVGPAQVPQRSDKREFTREAFVPPSVLGGEQCADEDLVDQGVVAHPWLAGGEVAGVLGEQRGPVGILEVTDPVRHAEVTQVGDRHQTAVLELAEGRVGELPVV